MQEAYIIGGLRTAFAKAGRGGFRFMRSDDLAIKVIKALLEKYPQLDKQLVDDVLVGNAVPEAEQGLQIGRMIALEAVGLDCAGMTMNRYCASGLETIATVLLQAERKV
jgi:acetyl-CoA acyltransferase